MTKFRFNMFETMTASAACAEASSACSQNEYVAVLLDAIIVASIFISRILRLDSLLSVLLRQKNTISPGRIRA